MLLLWNLPQWFWLFHFDELLEEVIGGVIIGLVVAWAMGRQEERRRKRDAE